MQTGDRKLIVSQTALPDIFVIRYAGELSADAIYTYLWINTFYHDKSFDLKNIFDASILSKADTEKALADLVSKDLLVRNGNSFHQTDIIAKEVDDYIRLERAYMAADSVDLPEDVKNRNDLAESIQNTFFQGKMPFTFYKLIDKCLFEYHFETTVVYTLFQEGLDRKCVKSIDQMKQLAKKWYDSGINSSEAIAEYKQEQKDIKRVTELMGKLTRRRMNNLDIERIEKWVTELDAPAELIEYAYKCNEFRGNIQMKHVEDTLTVWLSSGIRTVDDAAKYEEENHKENKRKAVKRKGRYSGAVTGAEAGITSGSDDFGGVKPESTTAEEDRPAFGNKDDDDDSSVDDILDIFGGDDD